MAFAVHLFRLFPGAQGLAGHGDEPHRDDGSATEAGFLFFQKQEILIETADGDDHFAFGPELPDQRIRNVVGSRRHDDPRLPGAWHD